MLPCVTVTINCRKRHIPDVPGDWPIYRPSKGYVATGFGAAAGGVAGAADGIAGAAGAVAGADDGVDGAADGVDGTSITEGGNSSGSVGGRGRRAGLGAAGADCTAGPGLD
jgi:hypothetical protein